MAILTTSATQAFLPQDVGALIILPVIAESIATQTSTVVQSGAASFQVPLITQDGSASWVGESVPIPVSAPTLGQAVVTFKALKALVPVSNEAMADITPEISAIIGASLARDISKKLDGAHYAAAVAGAPTGIKGIAATVVSAGGAWTDADPFIEAIYAAELVGATITAFVAHPTDALLLAQIREGSTSVRSLLQPDATQAGRRVIAGVPLFVSPAVTVGEIWAIPRDRSIVVIRSDVTVVVDSSAGFGQDETQIRAVLRCGWVWPQPAAVVKVTKA